MKKAGIVIAVLLTGGIAYAAYRYFNRQQKLLEDYTVEPVGISIKKMTADEWVIGFVIRFNNKSSIEAELKRLYADIYISEKNIGFVSDTKPAVIPGKGSADISMEVAFSPKIVFKNAVDIVLGVVAARDLPYRMKGFAELKSSFVSVSVPFEKSGTLKDFV